MSAELHDHRAAPSPAALALLGARPQAALAQGFAGLGRERGRICSRRARQELFVSRRSRPASGISHRVVVRDRESAAMPAAPPMARNGRCFVRRSQPGAQQEGWANQQIWMGHAAVTRADTHRYQRNICARRRRPGRRRGKAVSRLDRCLGDARARRMRDATHRAARSQGIRRRFQLRAAARRRPAAGAAGRRRLQPEIGARTGLVLLQPAVSSR